MTLSIRSLIHILSLTACLTVAAALKAKLNQYEVNVVHKNNVAHLASELLMPGSQIVERHVSAQSSSSAYQTQLPSHLKIQVLIETGDTADPATEGLASIVEQHHPGGNDERTRRALAGSNQDSSRSPKTSTADEPLDPSFFVDVVAPMNFQKVVSKGMLNQLAETHGGIVVNKQQTSEENFTADVAAPIELSTEAALPMPYGGTSEDLVHRHLQNQQLQCFQQTDGTLACVLDDFPREGLILVFTDCPNRVGATVFECGGCYVVEESSPSLIDSSDPRCTSCEICTDQKVSFDCGNIDANTPCAAQDCDGQCIGEGGTPASGGVTSDDVLAQCFEQENGSVACTVEKFPRDGLILVFLNCPTFAGSTLLDCNSCVIVEEENSGLIDRKDPQCSSCQICGDTVAFNCANIDPGVQCSVQNCEGQCLGGPPPSPSPTVEPPPVSQPSLPQPQPTLAPQGDPPLTCFQNGDTLACALEDFPRPGLIIVFFNCPSFAGSTVFDCETCGIIQEDDTTLISNDSIRCSGCTLCRSEQTVAFDCANVSPNDSCAVQDCGNQCIGGGGGGGNSGGVSGNAGVLFPVSVLMAVAALLLV